jgi:FecR protein
MRRRQFLVGSAGILLIREALAQDRLPPSVRRARSGDKLSAGADAELVFVVDRDAVLLRRSSSLEVLKNGFRLVSGAALAVFAPGARKTVQTPTATVGIRGTAGYFEVERSRTYVCICYGEAVLEPVGDPKGRETVRTRHHEQPRYIMASGAPKMVTPAPVLNHTDAELTMLESLVGRKPPFAAKGKY